MADERKAAAQDNPSRSLRLDCYGHEKLAPSRPAPPEGAARVGAAHVWCEMFADAESYWLSPAVGGAEAYELWSAFAMLPGKVDCCGILEPHDSIPAAGAADTLLRALWQARWPAAVSLARFEEGGLLSLEQLDAIREDYEQAHKPPAPSPEGHTGEGELHYDSGALRYRGELLGGLPHGRGVHYWENGAAWCEGTFREGEPHGECRIYFPDGALRYDGTMLDGSTTGRGTEYFNNGRIWFDGIFGRQSSYYGYGARIWVSGRLYDRDGNLVHEGRFSSGGKHSKPLVEEEVEDVEEVQEDEEDEVNEVVAAVAPSPEAGADAVDGSSAMKRYDGIDYDFRPDSYWDAGDPLALVLRHVKGTNRRQMIRDYWEAGVLKELDDQLLKDTLTEAERQRLGRIHPSFMGGEYLPDFKVGEEEVVRVELESTTSDVISVRARPVPGGIAWRVVDEYPDRGEYVVKPQFSRGPLSLAELIGMLDGALYDGPFEGGLPLGWNINSLECGGGDAAELRHFTTVQSSFYPELFAHYENVYDDWVEEHDGAVADDEDGDEEHEQEDAGDGDGGDEEDDAA